jgi:hypothetical protein
MARKPSNSDSEMAASFIIDGVVPLNPSDREAEPTDQQLQALERFRNLLAKWIGSYVRGDDLNGALSLIWKARAVINKVEPNSLKEQFRDATWQASNELTVAWRSVSGGSLYRIVRGLFRRRNSKRLSEK